MPREAVGIPSNINGDAARKGEIELRHFLSMAQGFTSGLDTQLELSVSLQSVSLGYTRC